MATVTKIVNRKLLIYPVACNRISQAEDKSVSQYLICAKDYLEHINHTSRLSSMDGSGLNHISLVQGLSDNNVRRRASKDAENWKTMVDAFDSIAKIARTAGKTKAYNEPRYEKPTDINAISYNYNNSQRGSFNRYCSTYKITKLAITAVGTIARTIHPDKIATKNQCITTVQVPHYITNCSQYQKDRHRYKGTTQWVKQSFQDKSKQGAKKNSININQAYFKNEEDDNLGDYSEEQAEELCKLLDTDSKWLNINEVHVNDIGDDASPILYKVWVNHQPVTAPFNTGASMSVIFTKPFDSLKHKPKILQCNRALRGPGDEALIPKSECFLQIKIGKQTFRDWVVIINNLNHD